jgi:hypothetical protein
MADRMKYWLDTEFIARPYTIDLISIGIGAEDGRELYAESNETDWSKASPGRRKMCARRSMAGDAPRNHQLRLARFRNP